METPLHRVQGLGSSHSGVRHFWRQRVTAAALIPLTLWFAWAALGLVGASDSQVLSFLTLSPLGIPLNAILMAIFAVIALYHMVLGLQVVIDDYVHGEGGKIFLMLLVRALALAIGAASLFALLRIAGPV
ncbi:MAG TPA: succinate dehydrogenase, hydrophobic membrane anchor protein [Rhizomicrobium sp.]|jgi:succinate dehydrogenase / fumarate reductase membrane anchor subunit|nr:succinate dehydrogenase, hydrophobic membrane anchor protein [Rhizomicrobium sp.]